MPESTMTSRGRITIPATTRKALGLTAKVRMVFVRLDDGCVVMRVRRKPLRRTG